MAKIPFDIKYRPQIESGEYKVETRDGLPARIICWDYKSTKYPILALYTFCDEEKIGSYCVKGCYYANSNDSHDLFIITPELELTEFEKRVEEICNSYKSGKRDSKEQIRYYASKLLELAYQKLKAELKQDFFEAEQDGIKKGIEVGKEEVLKDLPMWRKWPNLGKRSSRYRLISNSFLDNPGDTYLYDQGQSCALRLSDLEKLPRED